MKLADLLGDLGKDELERLAHEHVRTDEALSRPAMLNVIAGVLRSYRFVQEFIADRQPPTFAILLLLLDAPEFSLPTAGFREAVAEETKRICDLVARREILGRDDQLRLYRRVLFEARRNDLALDASESAILGVLRRELKVAQVEHFLIEHHVDLHEFWNKEHAFLHEINALRSGGIVFARDGVTMLAEDVAPLIRQVLGVEMARHDARRLCAHLSNNDLSEALSAVQAKTSGSKEERIERLITHMVQPRTILRATSLTTLRDVCRDTGAAVSGSKEELIERIVSHFATGRDQKPDTVPPPPIVEERHLDEARFRLLFESLRGHELDDILRAFSGLRVSGTKEARVATLWAAQRSEETLLGTLVSRDLEAILARNGLRLTGSKRERIDRLVAHFASVEPVSVPSSPSYSAAENASTSGSPEIGSD